MDISIPKAGQKIAWIICAVEIAKMKCYWYATEISPGPSLVQNPKSCPRLVLSLSLTFMLCYLAGCKAALIAWKRKTHSSMF